MTTVRPAHNMGQANIYLFQHKQAHAPPRACSAGFGGRCTLLAHAVRRGRVPDALCAWDVAWHFLAGRTTVQAPSVTSGLNRRVTCLFGLSPQLSQTLVGLPYCCPVRYNRYLPSFRSSGRRLCAPLGPLGRPTGTGQYFLCRSHVDQLMRGLRSG